MTKTFYTDHDIEDLVKRGIMSLTINDNIVLTDLAYEKARRLGMSLITAKAYTPPAAPVRPYISKENQQTGFERKPVNLPVNESPDHLSMRKESQHTGIVPLAKRSFEQPGPIPGYPTTQQEIEPNTNDMIAQIVDGVQHRFGKIDPVILEKMITRVLSKTGIL